MNVVCNTGDCPVLLDSKCVFYEGSSLPYTGIVANDSIQAALIKLDNKFQDAGLGYAFYNGVYQSAPGELVGLGGDFTSDVTIGGAYTLTLIGDLEAAALITTGGTSSDFVKGDGSLDGTAYQPTGNYITALTGDGTASGPGSVAFTLATVNVNPGAYGDGSNVPVITVNGKGLVTNITPTAIIFPTQSVSFTGDISGLGMTGSNITLTLNTVNSNVFGVNTPLKFAVNEKGLVTSAAALTNLDIDGLYGYTPVPSSRTITINGVTLNLANDRSWTIAASSSTLQEVTDNGDTTDNDLEITDTNKGLILQSPNGTRWRFGITNSGNLTATSL